MTYDRAAIMRDAHKRFRDGKRLGLGWTFGQCLSTAWRAAKERRKAIYEELHPETRHGGDHGNQHTGGKRQDDNLSFCQNTASATGKDRRTIERAAARGAALGEDLRRRL